MTKRLFAALAMVGLLAGAALAVSPEQSCTRKKLVALAKRDYCRQRAQARALFAEQESGDARCAEKLARRLRLAENAAPCRWLEHGDGTVTDLNTGLQWEMKSGVDVDDSYVWDDPGFGVLIYVHYLNWTHWDLTGPPPSCKGGRCDWRMPTMKELKTLIEPNCVTAPCTTIPGATATGEGAYYWSSSIHIHLPGFVWGANLDNGSIDVIPLHRGAQQPYYIRAVRGRS